MKEVLFNGHDIALVLVVGLSMLLALRLLTNFSIPQRVRLLAAALFGLIALCGLDTLIFWSDSLRGFSFYHLTWLPLGLSFAHFLLGPVLYGLTKISVHPDEALSGKYFCHFIPALLTPVYLYWACFRFSPDQQASLILNLEMLANSDVFFLWFLSLKKLVPIAYGAACLLSVYHFEKGQWKSRSCVEVVPLLYFVMPVIWVWSGLTHILGQWLPIHISDAMGVFGNYVLLALVSSYVFNRAGDGALLITIKSKETIAGVAVDEIDAADAAEISSLPVIQYSKVTIQSHHDKVAKAVLNFMANRYADSNISLAVASASTGVSRGKLNDILKQETGLTFSSYLNQLRLTEAARLLKDDTKLSIAEIALSIGYNNVTYFNKLFKIQHGVTPKKYRASQLSSAFCS